MTINDAPYYLLRANERVDCLDRARSKFVTFPNDPTRIMRFKKYAFHFDRLSDPAIFCIPEEPCSLFVTQSVRDLVVRDALRGFGLTFLDGTPMETPPRSNRPVVKTYTNDYFGLRIDVPEPWELVSWKTATIARDWRQHFQMRDDEIPDEERIGKFLFTAHRYSPLSRATLDASIEVCVFRLAPGMTLDGRLTHLRSKSEIDGSGMWEVGGAMYAYCDKDLRRPDGGTIRSAYHRFSDGVWVEAKISGYEDQFFQDALRIFEGLSWRHGGI